jgi:hypothetical protein
MKVELDINAVTVAENERLIMVFPTDAFPLPMDEDEDDPLEDLHRHFERLGIGDRVLLICADDVQMGKVKA